MKRERNIKKINSWVLISRPSTVGVLKSIVLPYFFLFENLSRTCSRADKPSWRRDKNSFTQASDPLSKFDLSEIKCFKSVSKEAFLSMKEACMNKANRRYGLRHTYLLLSLSTYIYGLFRSRWWSGLIREERWEASFRERLWWMDTGRSGSGFALAGGGEVVYVSKVELSNKSHAEADSSSWLVSWCANALNSRIIDPTREFAWVGFFMLFLLNL
jgi:hypothetical protein